MNLNAWRTWFRIRKPHLLDLLSEEWRRMAASHSHQCNRPAPRPARGAGAPPAACPAASELTPLAAEARRGTSRGHGREPGTLAGGLA